MKLASIDLNLNLLIFIPLNVFIVFVLLIVSMVRASDISLGNFKN
jgi:hypothetical protein